MAVIVDLGPLVKERALAIGKLTPPLFWNFWPEKLSVSLVNFKYGDVIVSTQPKTIATLSIANGSSVQQSQQIQDSKKTTATFRLSVSRGLRVGKQQNFSFNIPKVGSLGGSVSLETTLTEATEKTTVLDQTWAWSIGIPVPPKTRIEVVINVLEALYRPNFDAVVQVAGEVGMRYKVTASGQPIEKFWYFPIGRLFRQISHPDIIVVDDSTIHFAANGFVDGIEGVKYEVTTSEFPYPDKDDADHQPDRSLPSDSLVMYEDARVLDRRVCPTCTGTGRCQNCGGQGKIRCSTCNGQGSIAERCPTCGGTGTIEGESACPICSGTGEINRTCQSCSGAGDFECNQCRGSGGCKDCGGTGETP